VPASRLGQRVFGAVSPLRPEGAHAEFVAVPSCDAAPAPARLSSAQAAALPFAALTAWRALFGPGSPAALPPSWRALVLGAGGSVGGAAVQLACWATGGAAAGRVAAVCGAGSAERVRRYGAAEVLDSAQPLREAPPGWRGSFNLVLDCAGGGGGDARAAECVPLLRPGGRYVTLDGGLVTALDGHGLALGAAAAAAQLARANAAAALAGAPGVRVEWATMRCDWEAWEAAAGLAAEGLLEPHLGEELPWELAASAHEAVEARRAGKVVLTFDEPAAPGAV